FPAIALDFRDDARRFPKACRGADHPADRRRSAWHRSAEAIPGERRLPAPPVTRRLAQRPASAAAAYWRRGQSVSAVATVTPWPDARGRQRTRTPRAPT